MCYCNVKPCMCISMHIVIDTHFEQVVLLAFFIDVSV